MIQLLSLEGSRPSCSNSLKASGNPPFQTFNVQSLKEKSIAHRYAVWCLVQGL